MRLQGRARDDRQSGQEQPSGDVAEGPLADSRIAAVLRLLRGEPLLTVAEEVDVPPAVLLGWRDAFLDGGHERLDRPATALETGPAPGVVPVLPQGAVRRRSRPTLRRLPLLLGVGVAIAVIAAAVVVAVVRGRDGAGGWVIVYDGFGKAGTERTEEGEDVHFLKPMISQAPEETHGALKVTERRYGDLDLRLRVRTLQQLRTGSAPNPWETAWVVWHYTDDQNFYYLTLKPNGWELGKRDPGHPGGQRFLASDTTPAFYFATWYDVRIEQIGPTITAWVGDLQLIRFVDEERPYRSGKVGLYVEDAYAQFADVEPKRIELPRGSATGTSPSRRSSTSSQALLQQSGAS